MSQALKKLVGNCTSNCKFANCLAPMGKPVLDLWAKLGKPPDAFSCFRLSPVS